MNSFVYTLLSGFYTILGHWGQEAYKGVHRAKSS